MPEESIPENTKYKVSAWIILGSLFIAGYFFLDGSPERGEDIRPEDGIAEEENEQSRARIEVPENILGELVNSPNVLTGDLAAVDGSDSKGTGYLLFRNNMTLHAVVAELPEPAEGNVYEGWLVQPDPLKFFSTGVMEKVAEDSWVLEYARAGDHPSFTRVVITEEEKLDGIPETHIIEGDVE